MEINLRFYVVQYADSLIAKGRNVAVIAYDGWRVYYKALGVDGNEIKPEYFQSISRKARDSEWVYREWLYWFDSLTKVHDAQEFNDAIIRLKTNRFGLMVDSEGVVELTDSLVDIAVTMDNLFRQMVRKPRISPIIVFENRVAEIFRRSEISYHNGFINEPAEVEMISEESNDVVTLEFSHLLSGENPIGFSTLVLQGIKHESLSIQTERIAENFNNAIRTGFIPSDRCILLCGRFQKKHQEIINQISGVATVLDVFDELTPMKISRLVGLNS
jgi:hypothetical protein